MAYTYNRYSPALRGLLMSWPQQASPRPRLQSPAGGQGIGESVYEADPSLNLPVIAPTAAGQGGLDFLRSRLGPEQDFAEQQRATSATREAQRQARLLGFESPQAAAQFERGLGPEYERAQEQKRQQAVLTARAGLHPDVQRQAELAARRSAYPSEAQARGMGLQALLGVRQREATAAGQVEARRAARDAAALNAMQRSIDTLAQLEEITPEQAALIESFRDQIERVRRGEFFLSDFGFTEDELNDLAEMEEQFGAGTGGF